MQRNLRPYVTAGIAIVGASLIAVTPVTQPPTNVQQRVVKLVDYDEYDLTTLASVTEANLSGLEEVFGSTDWTTDPDISTGFSTLFTDLTTGTANPVTNPFSLLIEGGLLLFTSTDAANGAATAFTAVADNLESDVSGGNFTDVLTDLENGPTTVLYGLLDGYPGGDVGTGTYLSPEFGLLTNTDGYETDGFHAATGQLDGLQQLSNTVADEISAIGGGDLTVTPTLLDTSTVEVNVSTAALLNELFPSGTIDLPLNVDTLLGILLPGDPVLSSVATLLGTGGSTDISIPVSELEGLLPSDLPLGVTLPAIDGPAVPLFDYDLSQDALADLGSIAPVSSVLPTLLTSDPTLNATSLLDSLLTELSLPISLAGSNIPLDLTGIVSELLAGLDPV